MNFERGIEVKEAAGLGIKANAPRIKNLFTIEWEMNGYSSDLMQKHTNIVEPKVAMEYLIKISEGKIDPKDFVLELETEDGVGSLEPLWKYKGRYLKYRAGGYQAVSAYDYENEFTHREIIFKIPEE